MSDRPHPRYRKVFFDADWLEDWVVHVLETKFDMLYSKSEFGRDKAKRAVAYWALIKYGGLAQREVCERYGQQAATVSGLIASVNNNSFATSKAAVIKSLEPFIPVKQANEMVK
jgi:hypothetical protein